MNIVNNYSKYLIAIFIAYLALAPTSIVESGLMRFIPTLAIIVIFLFGIISFKSGKCARMGTIVALFVSWILICAAVHPSVEGSKVMTLLKSSYWCWIYFIAYTIFVNQSDNETKMDRVIMVATVLFALSFNYSHISRAVELELAGDNAVFYSLLMMPWITCISNSTKRWATVAIVALCAITALKRSGIIILFTTVAILYYCDFLYRKRLQPKTILTAIMVIAGVFAVFQFKADSIDSISQRFELIEDDGGSGRDMIYEDVINRYQNSDLIYQIFGRGFDTVKGKDTTMALSAHNDFLEVLYDFGAIGFIFYLLIHLSLIKWTIRLLRARSQLAFPVLISYVCFIVMSMVSHLILYPTYFGLLTAFWAYAECKDNELQYQKSI